MKRLTWIALLTIASVSGCKSSDGPEVGGDTHWLAACDGDSHCQRGLCICGICTAACDDDAQCEGGRSAACYQSASPGVQQHCTAARAMVAEAEGICLARCADDVECADGERCIGGACVRAAQPPTAADAGVIDPTAPPLPQTRASEFAELEPDVSFDEPAAVPEPRTTFEVPDEVVPALLGTWRLGDCSESYPACPWFEIVQQQDTGEVAGRFHWEPNQDTDPLELPDEIDPGAGYPPGVDPVHYDGLLTNPLPAGFRMLDARFQGDVLSFWVAPTELWEPWCALQTSYANPGGDPAYICVQPDQVGPDSPVDLGRQALCTSELTAGVCDGDRGPVACSCYRDGQPIGGPLCSAAFCHCDAGGCRANLHARRQWVELRLKHGTLEVTRWYDPLPAFGLPAIAFHRELSP